MLLVDKGQNFKLRASNLGQQTFRRSISVGSLIQLLRKSNVCKFSRFSTFFICRMKLWFKSNFFKVLFSLRPQISSISLKARIKVYKFTKFERASKRFILLLNKLRYNILVKSLYLDKLTRMCSLIKSSWLLKGISGGIEFSIAEAPD